MFPTGKRCCLYLVEREYLTPLSPLQLRNLWAIMDISGWRGEFKGEGAKPPLKFSPPLKLTDVPKYM